MKQVTVDDEIFYKPAFYISRSLSKAEENFSVIELEGLAICYAVLKFQWFLLGRKFIIFTDHKPLVNFNISMLTTKESINMQCCYLITSLRSKA